jgi:pimeloyl-ACP methyl ester carboxylesterase
VKYILYFIIIFISFFLLTYLYFYFKLEDPKKIRKPLVGEFAPLKNGNIYFQKFESQNSNGEIIFLVHGFSTPSIVWKGVIPFLTESGFDVIAYDHYGRGYSARPKVNYTKDFYISTLFELKNFLNIDQKVHLVGYSMGGPIVGYFANEFPEMISSVNFIAPAGYMNQEDSNSNLFIKILTLPLISHYISIVLPSLMYGGNSSIKLSTEEDINKLSQTELNKVYEKQMKYEGFTRSLLSTAKHFNLFNTANMYKELGKKNIKTSVIWGSSDEIVSINGLDSMKLDIPSINAEIINNGKHDITYALPTRVGKFLASQLKNFLTNE